MNKPLCVLARAVCPETADPTKPAYCPAWVDQAPETERDGRGEFVADHIYRGCGFRRYMQWIQVSAAQVGRHTATVDQYRAEQAKGDARMAEAINALAANPLVMLAAAVAGGDLANVLPAVAHPALPEHPNLTSDEEMIRP